MQWVECLYCPGDEIKHRHSGSKGTCMLVVVAAKMKQKKTKSFSAHLPFIVYKNFPHTNELLEYDQHLKYKLLENSFGS